MSCLRKIISGGQTGVDRIALDESYAAGLETGGFAPIGYMTETGSDYALRDMFGLVESSTSRYEIRSINNVNGADGTLIFQIVSSPGTNGTIRYCNTGKWKGGSTSSSIHKPYYIITAEDLKDQKYWDKLRVDVYEFISKNNISVLNVAGNRGSKLPVGYDDVIRYFLRLLFSTI